MELSFHPICSSNSPTSRNVTIWVNFADFVHRLSRRNNGIFGYFSAICKQKRRSNFVFLSSWVSENFLSTAQCVNFLSDFDQIDSREILPNSTRQNSAKMWKSTENSFKNGEFIHFTFPSFSFKVVKKPPCRTLL